MWQRLQPREKILLATLGVCVVLFLLIYFLLLPQYDAFTRDRAQLADLEDKARAAENVLASERKESELAAEAAALLGEVNPFFDNEMNDGLAVAHVGFVATKANVRMDSFKPADIVNQGSHLELPTKFEVSGDYLDVIYFFKRMEGAGMPNLADLRTLKIEPEKTEVDSAEAAISSFMQESLGDVQNGRVTATFDLVIYASATPQGRLKLEQEAGWPIGRQNAFQTPGSVSPSPDIKAPVKETAAPASAGETPLNNLIQQLLNQGGPKADKTLPGSSGTVSLTTAPPNSTKQ
ncbi:MAG: type II secretion system protein GspM [Desulfotomaculaceae bacterium]|nr:type II secretion system protein GspM [Desulfotomaculaceae bacterium]